MGNCTTSSSGRSPGFKAVRQQPQSESHASHRLSFEDFEDFIQEDDQSSSNSQTDGEAGLGEEKADKEDPDSLHDGEIRSYSTDMWNNPKNTKTRNARELNPKDYDFENVVFEGGGNKGIAYCGAVRVLEKLGLWKKIRRLAGASAGAMTACLLAVGFNSHDLEKFFSQNLSEIFLDHKCGYCSLLPNLLTGFGWNPGNRIYDWFGKVLKKRCGNADITFQEVLEKYDRELCIVVTNLNQMTTEYLHPKTTPDMAVRLAVRMSMAIPGLFQPSWFPNYGQKDVYVDGGLLCNYPIHCFDGWWLSLKPKDNFLKRLQPLDQLPRLLHKSKRFGTFNKKTIGFLLFADGERELFRSQVERTSKWSQLLDIPDTKLARKRRSKRREANKRQVEHRHKVKALNVFLKVLEKHNKDDNDTIDVEELEAALNDQEFKAEHSKELFGDVDSGKILLQLDKDRNGKISYQELVCFMEEKGIDMQQRFLGYQRLEVKSFPTFFKSLLDTLLHNAKKLHMEERDVERTVGINTGHVDTTDFVLEEDDRNFLVERGEKACLAFLHSRAKKLPKRQTAPEAPVSAPPAASPIGVQMGNITITANITINTTDNNGVAKVFAYPSQSGEGSAESGQESSRSGHIPGHPLFQRCLGDDISASGPERRGMVARQQGARTNDRDRKPDPMRYVSTTLVSSQRCLTQADITPYCEDLSARQVDSERGLTLAGDAAYCEDFSARQVGSESGLTLADDAAHCKDFSASKVGSERNPTQGDITTHCEDLSARQVGSESGLTQADVTAHCEDLSQRQVDSERGLTLADAAAHCENVNAGQAGSQRDVTLEDDTALYEDHLDKDHGCSVPLLSSQSEW